MGLGRRSIRDGANRTISDRAYGNQTGKAQGMVRQRDVAEEGEKPAIAIDARQGGIWAESRAKT